MKFVIGGVPEHFNTPWYQAVEGGDFTGRPYEVTWRDFPDGTGAMCEALREREIHVAVLLADGVVTDILYGNPARIVGTYVETPLQWGIHVHADSLLERPEELAGQRFAISRRGSGSHLMAFVEAHMRGWLDEHGMEFVTVGGLEGARAALASGEAEGFMWERLMTRSLVEHGEWRRLGVRPSPWPAFLIAAHPSVIEEHPRWLLEILATVQRRCFELKTDLDASQTYIGLRFDLDAGATREWLEETEWRCSPEVSSRQLREVVDTLKRVGVIARHANPEELVAQEVCALSEHLPAKMYNWRVAGVRGALARAGKSSGALRVEDLLGLGHLDQYHYHGTDACDEAARILGIGEGSTVLDAGSGIGGPARYLAYRHGAFVTGVEIQPALANMSRELTARCGLSPQVRFITGDIAEVELAADSVEHVISMLTFMHLVDRAPAWRACFQALEPGGTFLVEDILAGRCMDDACRRDAREIMAAPNLVSAEEYVAEIEAAGFVDVACEDLTDDWRQWTAQRYDDFLSERERHIHLHGEQIYKARARYYRLVRDLFADGKLGGARVTGRKRGAHEVHLLANR